MFFDSIKLSRDAWHYRLQTWTFGQDPQFNNFCLYFWLTIFCICASPFVGGWKLLSLFISKLFGFLSEFGEIISQEIAFQGADRMIDNMDLDRIFQRPDSRYNDLRYGNDFCSNLKREQAYKQIIQRETGTTSFSLVVLLIARAKRKNIDVFRIGTPEEVRKGMCSYSETSEFFTDQMNAFVAQLENERLERIRKQNEKILARKKAEREKAQRDAERREVMRQKLIELKKKFEWVPDQTQIVMMTKKVFGWIIPIVASALLLWVSYLVITNAVAIIEFITFILPYVFYIIIGIVAIGGIVAVLYASFKFIFERLKNICIPSIDIPKPIIRFFDVIAEGITFIHSCMDWFFTGLGNVFKFMWQGFMMWKSDNCPAIIWENE